jgi:hypothetical protein
MVQLGFLGIDLCRKPQLTCRKFFLRYNKTPGTRIGSIPFESSNACINYVCTVDKQNYDCKSDCIRSARLTIFQINILVFMQIQ